MTTAKLLLLQKTYYPVQPRVLRLMSLILGLLVAERQTVPIPEDVRRAVFATDGGLPRSETVVTPGGLTAKVGMWA